MALEDFKTSDTSDDKNESGSGSNLSKSVEWTACDCQLEEIRRFEEPPDDLDLVAHMRDVHNMSYQDAVKRVKQARAMVA